jgi:hypothetical protein
MKTRSVIRVVRRSVGTAVGRTSLLLLALAVGMFAAPPAFADVLIVNSPVDVVGNLPGAQFTGDHFATQAYKDWGNEPSVAVNPLNPMQVVVSSFAFGTPINTNASIFYSTTGGSSWSTQFSVPDPNSVGIPNDWNFQYDSTGKLHAAVLGGGNIFQGATTDPTSLAAWTWTGSEAPINTTASLTNADQPWIAVRGGKVFVAYDDFHSGTGERVAVSNDNGGTFTIDHAINNGPVGNSVNPGTRITTDGAGNVYSIFGVGSFVSAGVHNVTYYLNRSHDGGNTWDFNGSSGVGGIIVGSGTSTQLGNGETQASNNWFAGVNDLRGNTTAIAADATGAHIYVIFGKQDSGGTDRLYLVEFHPSGGNLVASAPVVISPAGEPAALPSITVLANGDVVMMYDSHDANNKIHVHIATSTDFGGSIASNVETYSFTPLTLLAATGKGGTNREFGDYQYMTSLGNTFYGAFAGLGNVNGGGIDTTGLIDPFFVSGTDTVPEPGTLLMLATGLFGVFAGRRKLLAR